jgi:hypothetical protein
MIRLLFALCVAFLAYSFARALGVPIWRDWQIGDATDIALTAFYAAWIYTKDRLK